jgi:hypothetical protein
MSIGIPECNIVNTSHPSTNFRHTNLKEKNIATNKLVKCFVAGISLMRRQWKFSIAIR